MPTKSVCACCEFALRLVPLRRAWPKTCVMSPVAAVDVFSSSMFAVPTPPTSQPARVNGTHGAGVVFCPSVIMFGSVSFDRIDRVRPVLERARERRRVLSAVK